jgi:GT2 family glycosyltransferase
MAMRRETFDAVGGFDGGFVLWGQEDAELSIRLWTFGYTCLLVPTVAVSHLFRPTHPYHITWETVLHNMLRLAVVHFRQERIDRLLDHARSNGAFPAAWQRLTATDAWERRAVVQAARQFDDSWFFERFGMA